MDQARIDLALATSSTSLPSLKRKDEGSENTVTSQPNLKTLKTEVSPASCYKFVVHDIPKNVKYSHIESLFTPLKPKAIDLQKPYGPLKLVEVEFSTLNEFSSALYTRNCNTFHFSNTHLPRLAILRTPQQTQDDLDQLPAAWAALPDTIVFTIFTYFDYLTRMRLSRVCKKWKHEMRKRITSTNKIAYLNYTDITKVPTWPRFYLSNKINHLLIRAKSYAAFKTLKLWKFIPQHPQITKLTLSHFPPKNSRWSAYGQHIPPNLLHELWFVIKYIRLLNCDIEVPALVVKVSRGSLIQGSEHQRVMTNRVWTLRIKSPEVVMQATERSSSWMESLIKYYATSGLLWPYGADQVAWLNTCLGEIRKNDPEHMSTIQNYVNSAFAQLYASKTYLQTPADQSVVVSGRKLNKLDLAMVTGYIASFIRNRTQSRISLDVDLPNYSDIYFSKKLPLPPQVIPEHFWEGYSASIFA